MRSVRVLGVIPARLRSSRLARKPLQILAGRPLIEWVWRRVSRFDALDEVVVATDAPEIEAVCRSIGAQVVMTSEAHPSGTDRVAEAVQRGGWSEVDVVVNIQGDEPFIEEAHVAAAIEVVRSGWSIGTVATPLLTRTAYEDTAVVKVVRRPDGAALYFSRAGVPHVRDGGPTENDLRGAPFLRHVGLYAYTPAALAAWVALPPSALEQLEKLEQLRPLEAGVGIGVAVVGAAEGGVDTPADAERAERLLRKMAEQELEQGSEQ